jgi:hypothetical protein
MQPNKPTPPRRFGTDSSLSWDEQADYIRKASSKAVTRLFAMLDMASDAAEISEIVLALQRAQAMSIKSGTGSGTEPTDEELVRKAKS